MVNTEFIRFVVPSRTHPESHTAIGVIAIAYELARSADIDVILADELQQRLAWLEQHLAVPARFNRTTSKGWYRRESRGISWLRRGAIKHVSALRALSAVVERCGIEVVEIQEDRVGYIIYTDDVQVVAEPLCACGARWLAITIAP